MPNGTAERVFNYLGMRQTAFGRPSIGVYQGERRTRSGKLNLAGSVGEDVFRLSAELTPTSPFSGAARISVEIQYNSKMKPAEVARQILGGMRTPEYLSEDYRELVEECERAFRGIEKAL